MSELERVRLLVDKQAPKYDRRIRLSERLLFGGGREWVCSRAHGRTLEIALGTGLNLLRIRRRFRTWLAPTLALAAMAAMFSLSTFVIGPLITGSDSGGSQPGIQQPGGHMGHHHK